MIGLKSSVKYTFPQDVGKMKVYSYDFLPIEKIDTLHNIILHIKALPNEDKCYQTLYHVVSISLKPNFCSNDNNVRIHRDKNNKKIVLCFKKMYKNLGC